MRIVVARAVQASCVTFDTQARHPDIVLALGHEPKHGGLVTGYADLSERHQRSTRAWL
jgi:hypothetical protein